LSDSFFHHVVGFIEKIFFFIKLHRKKSRRLISEECGDQEVRLLLPIHLFGYKIYRIARRTNVAMHRLVATVSHN